MPGANLHIEAMAWLRFTKQMPLVCTEVGAWNADVLGIDQHRSIEVEVKKSLSDLRADFKNKRNKHYVYERGDGGSAWSRAQVPNFMYFIVDEVLRDRALQVLEDHPKYGLLSVPTFTYDRETASTGYSAGKNVVNVRKAQRLHTGTPGNDFVWRVIKRLSSELVGAYQSHEELERRLLADLEGIRANVRASAAIMAAFTPEPPDPTYSPEETPS